MNNFLKCYSEQRKQRTFSYYPIKSLRNALLFAEQASNKVYQYVIKTHRFLSIYCWLPLIRVQRKWHELMWRTRNHAKFSLGVYCEKLKIKKKCYVYSLFLYSYRALSQQPSQCGPGPGLLLMALPSPTGTTSSQGPCPWLWCSLPKIHKTKPMKPTMTDRHWLAQAPIL